MVLEAHGDQIWEQIFAHAGLSSGTFIHLNAYPDQITFDLLTAASDILKVPPQTLLFQFGRYWSEQTLVKEYDSFLRHNEMDLKSFLLNLPNLHARIQLVLPALEPPKFRCSHIQAKCLHLHYYSEREGFSPFVEGIIIGLGTVFDCQVQIQRIQAKDREHDHTVFEVNWQ